MPLIDSLESRLGRFAIPGLVQIVAILQMIVFCIFYLGPVDMKAGLVAVLIPQYDQVLSGKVWLMFTHVLMPPFGSLFACFCMSSFTLWLGRVLEEAWGAFRVNLYVMWLIFSIGCWSLFFGFSLTSYWLFSTLVFAVAVLVPNEEILLFYLIPVKMKWIATADACLMFFMFVQSPFSLLFIFFANLNFLFAFGTHFYQLWRQRAKVSDRRARHQAAQMIESSYFHQCQICKKTELDDRSLDFRVTADGDEICNLCRNKKSRAPH